MWEPRQGDESWRGSNYFCQINKLINLPFTLQIYFPILVFSLPVMQAHHKKKYGKAQEKQDRGEGGSKKGPLSPEGEAVKHLQATETAPKVAER